MRDSPNAAMLMHLLVARVGEHNAVVVSQKTMAKIMGRHVNTVKTAFKTLRDRNWIEIRQVGERGTIIKLEGPSHRTARGVRLRIPSIHRRRQQENSQ